MITPEHIKKQRERCDVPSDIGYAELLDILVEGRIPVGRFGVDKAKSFEQLLKEVHEGESTLSIDGYKNLYRHVEVIAADVMYEHPDGRRLILREEAQILKDGRMFQRTIDSSIAEKLKKDEPIEAALTRALAEELGVTSFDRAYHRDIDQQQSLSPTYPGIISTYTKHRFVVMLSDAGYSPNGYMEQQDDKDTYFQWRELS